MITPDLLQKVTRVIRSQWRHFEYNISRKINMNWFDVARYQLLMGERPNLKNPQTMSEKLLWLNRHWQPQIKADCTDKIKVRDYVKSKGLEHLLVPMIGIWSTPEEINFDSLPNQFVLKCNHGCGCNIICKDKSKLDILETRHKLSEWLKIDYSKLFNEKHYSKIHPKILCEEYLPTLDGQISIVDYKIHCFNGEPQFFLICSDRNRDKNTLTLSSYTLDWKRENYLVGESDKMNYILPKPKLLNNMIEYSRILAKHFVYVRVDFYEIEEKLYFGELTFTPAANVMPYYRKEFQEKIGDKLILPKLK